MGWDEPDTAFMREHIEQMERTPFDGCVFHVNFREPDGAAGNFTWKAWSRRRFSADALAAARADLLATRFRRFKHNFLRFNATPGDLDWFDDFEAVRQNARLAARLARDGGARGVLFDTEQYEGQLFDYARQRDAASKSWDVYAAQARRRGRELMRAFEEGYPGLTVFLTFGSSLPLYQMQMRRQRLFEASYGLLVPFIDGMLDAARRARLVDGYELSYAYRELAHFRAGRDIMQNSTPAIVADPSAYRRVTSFGFGLWLDCDWRVKGWDPEQPEKNYFSPERFEAALRAALSLADEYVWIYTETPRWWSKEGGAVKLPAAYDAAVRRAKAAAGSSPSPPR
jgi:hypothetical protein